MTLQLGFSQTAITPTVDRSVYLAGFGRNRVAESVHDDLWARALFLKDETGSLLLVALDLLGLARPHCLEIEARLQEHLPGLEAIICCTHTHHGPDTIGLWGPDETTSGVDPEYISSLKQAIIETGLSAAQTLRPVAAVSSAGVWVPGVAKNSRDPEILDIELTAVQFKSAEQVLASLYIFPCHPEVLSDGNTRITSDYVFSLRQEVEAATGAPCLFIAGALGGMMTPDVPRRTFDQAAGMGRTLAQAGLRALEKAEQHAVVNFLHERIEFETPLSNPLFKLAIQAGLLPTLDGSPEQVTTEANLVCIGPLGMITVPGELLPKLGLQIRAGLRAAGAETAAVAGLANDEIGYILPVEDFVYPEDPFEPGAHYEESMALCSRTGPDVMWAAAVLTARLTSQVLAGASGTTEYIPPAETG